MWKLPRVALPTEGVDRNYPIRDAQPRQARVALPTEGVDRNNDDRPGLQEAVGRPPHGGRG